MPEAASVRSGATALVTGAAGGIGAAAARRLQRDGYTLVLADVDETALDKIVGELGAHGAVTSCVVDQTKQEDVDAVFRLIKEQHGTLDVCFANAGIGRLSTFLEQSLQGWRQHIDVNLTGTFAVCQGAATLMVDGGREGSIVVTTSSGAVAPAALFGAYCTSKAALNMLVQVMAVELGSFGIRVNAIMPGVTATPMTQDLLDSGAGAHVARQTPLGRIADPDEIAAVVGFLASRDSAFITGQALLIDGGGTHGVPRWFSTDHTQRGTVDWQLTHVAYARPNT